MNISLFDYAGGIQLLGGLEMTIFLPVILAGICLIGFAGNFLTCVVLIHDFRNGKASVINKLLINLSAIDLLIIALCVPIRAVTYSRQWWTLGGFVCKTVNWFQHCCLVAKSFTLAVMGQERYNYIFNTPKFLNFNAKQTIGAIVSIWTVSLLLPIPHIIFNTAVQYNGVELCVFEVPLYAANFMNVFSKIYPVAAYVIPMIYTAICYSKVLRTKPRMNKARNASQKNKRITLILVCVSVTYAFMWLPELSAWIWARHSDAFRRHTGFIIFAQVFLYVSSTVNPIIFLVMSEDFREGLASVWKSLCQKGSTAPENTRSPKARESGPEVRTSVMYSLHDLKTVSSSGNQEALLTDGSILPDVEHFWQERRTTTAGDEHDPIPWER